MIGAVRALVRSEIRRHWRSLAVVVLLVGFAGAVTLGAVAGARRTATSFDRFLESSRVENVLVFAQDIGPADVEELRALPGVEGVGYLRQLALIRPDGEFLAVGGPLDDSWSRDVDRLRLVAGRATKPGAADEVVVGEALADQSGIAVGDALALNSFTQEQVDAENFEEPLGPKVTLRVVGISRSPVDLSLQGAEGGVLALPRAFVETYGDRIANFSGPTGGVLSVRLDDGDAGVDRFLGQLRSTLGDRPFDVDPAALTTGGVQESIDLLAVGVLVFGVVAGIAALIATGVVSSRQVALLAAGQDAVRDLGMSRRLRALAVAGPVLIAVAGGVLLAVFGVWLLSPLAPFGVAGRAEPDPGAHFDVSTLGVGAVALAVMLLVIVAVPAWRATRWACAEDRGRRKPSAVSRSLEALGLAPPATIGVGLALEPGRGRTAVPVRSSLFAAALAVLGVTAVVVFSANLRDLVDTPRSYGASWDALIEEQRSDLQDRPCGRVSSQLTDDPDVAAVGNVCTLSITLDERAVNAMGVTALRGELEPTVLEGRAPAGADEVALGSDTLDAFEGEIGDHVSAQTPAGRFEYQVVGRIVMPSVGESQAVADGALFTGDGLAQLYDPENVSGTTQIVMRFRAGVDQLAAARRIERLLDTGAPGTYGVGWTTVPLEVERLEQVDRLPIALAAFLAGLGAIAIGYLLVTSVQRRRRDFAVLKSLGFRTSQISATVAVQAGTVAAVGLGFGLIPGVAAGSLLWRTTAERVGVVAHVELPIPVLVAVALGTVVLAVAVAIFPARAAARTRVAVTLRTE